MQQATPNTTCEVASSKSIEARVRALGNMGTNRAWGSIEGKFGTLKTDAAPEAGGRICALFYTHLHYGGECEHRFLREEPTAGRKGAVKGGCQSSQKAIYDCIRRVVCQI